jgi:hypothetical protein
MGLSAKCLSEEELAAEIEKQMVLEESVLGDQCSNYTASASALWRVLA